MNSYLLLLAEPSQWWELDHAFILVHGQEQIYSIEKMPCSSPYQQLSILVLCIDRLCSRQFYQSGLRLSMGFPLLTCRHWCKFHKWDCNLLGLCTIHWFRTNLSRTHFCNNLLTLFHIRCRRLKDSINCLHLNAEWVHFFHDVFATRESSRRRREHQRLPISSLSIFFLLIILIEYQIFYKRRTCIFSNSIEFYS